MRKVEKTNIIGAFLTLAVIQSLILLVFKERWNIQYIWVFFPIWGYISIIAVFFIFSLVYNFNKYRNNIYHGRDNI